MRNDIATKARYYVKGSEIYRGDEIIACFQNGKIVPLPGCERYHIQASRAWNAQAPTLEEKVVSADAQPNAPTTGIPPMPEANPLLGDKTPDVIRWYRDYHPDEFVRRYKGRKYAPLD